MRVFIAYAHPSEMDPDSNSKSFAELQRGGDALGGLKLALHCVHYAETVKPVKNAFVWRWTQHKQFLGLVKVLSNEDAFERIRKYHQLPFRHSGPGPQNSLDPV